MEEQPDQTRILVVDDESAIRDYLSLGLRYEKFAVREANDAIAARREVASWKPQVIILDIMMPGTDGFQLASELRADPTRIIIFLTARDEVDDRVRGLDLGADDYLVKPFAFKELLARIRRHLRRQWPAYGQELRAGTVVLDPVRHIVTVQGKPVDLSPREFELLTCFLLHPSQVLSKSVLLDQVWGYDWYGDENIVEVYVKNLRDKLADGDRRIIQTVRGVGYRLGD